MKRLADTCLDACYLVCRLVAFDDASFTRDEELSEVPLDVWRFIVVGILLAHHAIEQFARLVVEVKAPEAFLGFQPDVEWGSIVTVHVNLVKLWELNVEIGCAELVYLLDGTRSLFAELVAGEVENLQPLSMIFLIE